MKFKVTKLDRRHAWNELFQYMLTFNKMNYPWRDEIPGVLDFDLMCQQLTESFGWSQDVKTRYKLFIVNKTVEQYQQGAVNEHWSYSTDYDDFRIYLNEQAMSFVQLKWAGNETI
jgi:hypothetical protein